MNITIIRTLNKDNTLTLIMRKSAFTTVLLIAILFTGAITTASTTFIDTEASSDKKDKKKDKDYERDYEREYDKKDKEYKDEDREYEKDYASYKEYEEDYKKYGDDKKDSKDMKYDDDYNSNYKQKEYEKDDKKELYKMKSPYQDDNVPVNYDSNKPKKIKIVDCSNLNVNAGEEDISQVETLVDEAFNAQNSEDRKLNSMESQVMNGNYDNIRAYNVGSDTKIIFKCNNWNHNFASANDAGGSDESSLDTNTLLLAAQADKSNNEPKVDLSQSQEVTNNTASVEQPTQPVIQPSQPTTASTSQTVPSNEIPPSVAPEIPTVPFIFPIPSTIE